jgi:MFS transporter, ACS family, allantoate permease
MKKDAHLVGSRYSWLMTIFYIGYLVFEFPIGYLFQKVDIARTCAVLIILWGMVLLYMTAANDFAGLATSRFFLGLLESGVSP